MRRTLALALAVAALAACPAAWGARSAEQARSEPQRIADTRGALWRCEAELGRTRTRAAQGAWEIVPGRYRRWVMHLWAGRARTCAAALRAHRREEARRRTAESTPRGYAHALALARGWSTESLDAIIGQESGYNPCASYPGRHDCRYAGSSACGVPQANPCPHAWRGRLAETWRAQVRWLIAYIARRYGHVDAALRFKRASGWY